MDDKYINIKEEYFQWLYDYMCEGRMSNTISYKKLFTLLHETEFIYYIKKDSNRAMDGIDLRYRFSLYKHDKQVENMLDGPCSVLEMMIALAVRCEETIMDDPRYGDRTGQWFWSMLSNLSLKMMTDDHFDKAWCNKSVYTFLTRTYEPNGRGNIIYIPRCQEDLRKQEIWVQLNWYLNTFN